jgi:hypothetical protein
MSMQLKLLHLSARDDHPAAVPSFVQLGVCAEARHHVCAPDERYDRFEGTQRTFTPIVCDMAKQVARPLVNFHHSRLLWITNLSDLLENAWCLHIRREHFY